MDTSVTQSELIFKFQNFTTQFEDKIAQKAPVLWGSEHHTQLPHSRPSVNRTDD